jgi:hypothetical protein
MIKKKVISSTKDHPGTLGEETRRKEKPEPKI